MKKTKIGLIVEGASDKKFFNEYFKQRYDKYRGMKVITSGVKDLCKITNKNKIKNKIKELRLKNCNEIYIMIDLKTNCIKDIYECVGELRDDYIKKLDLSGDKDVNVIVVSSELEAWLLSAYKKSDKRTKEDLQKEFDIKSSKNIDEVLYQHFIKLQKDINHNNNHSLCYFLKKLGIVEEKEKCR
jgi:hypothetical protein